MGVIPAALAKMYMNIELEFVSDVSVDAIMINCEI